MQVEGHMFDLEEALLSRDPLLWNRGRRCLSRPQLLLTNTSGFYHLIMAREARCVKKSGVHVRKLDFAVMAHNNVLQITVSFKWQRFVVSLSPPPPPHPIVMTLGYEFNLIWIYTKHNECMNRVGGGRGGNSVET